MLSKNQKEAVHQSIHEAERVTAAHIALVTAPASDAYHSVTLVYGLVLGSLVASGLWLANITALYPVLLAVQLACVTLLFLPPLRRACICLVPKRLKHHRAAHRAFEEYLFVSRHAAHDAPVVLLFVSLAERYAHILPSRKVRASIPDENWNAVIAEFTVAVKTGGLEQACLGAVAHMARILTPHFPVKD